MYRANKYGAKRTEYGGVVYDSKREANHALELDLRVKAGDIVTWERQVPITITVNGYKICKVVVDFLLTYSDGHRELEEVKGMETGVFKLKKKLLEATFLKDNPDYKYTIVK